MDPYHGGRGGRPKLNPEGSPYTHCKTVYAAARAAGVQVKRGGRGCSPWFFSRDGAEWFKLAGTNYLARKALLALKRLNVPRDVLE